ncbi:TPA: NAD-dependent epimerase/dehydratase family protein, partial [Escherichia coli]
MKILITGANGFIGRNLSLRLEELGYKNLIRIDRDSTEQDLEQGLQDADFI